MSPSIIFYLMFEAESLTEPEVHHFSWTGWPTVAQHLPVPRLQVYNIMPDFYVDARDMNFSPHA